LEALLSHTLVALHALFVPKENKKGNFGGGALLYGIPPVHKRTL
jgi:hypothetical protein